MKPLMVGIAALILGATPSNAGVIYTSGPINGTDDAFTINNGQSISDSFIATTTGLISLAEVGIWVNPGEKLNSVGWSIGTSYFASDYGSGVAITTGTFVENNGRYDVYDDFLSLPSISVAAGTTYYFTLSDAVTSGGNLAYWDINTDPSTAESKNTSGTSGPYLPSESFTLSSASAAVPEPLTLSLFGAGFGGVILRRRKRVACVLSSLR